MLKSVTKQMTIYLFSFWFTWIFIFSHIIYIYVNGRVLYNFFIFANCIYHLQGFIFALVYFFLDRVSHVDVSLSVRNLPERSGQLTVDSIRESAERSLERLSSGIEENGENRRQQRRITFNIFEGEPDENSPWAKFFNEEDDEDESQHKDDDDELQHKEDSNELQQHQEDS